MQIEYTDLGWHLYLVTASHLLWP